MIYVSHITIQEGTEDHDVQIIGPFASHVEANGWMQKEFDAIKEQIDPGIAEFDDSDESHFIIIGEDVQYHWIIRENQTP